MLKPGKLYKNGVEIAETESKKDAWEIVKQETGYHVDYVRKQVNNPNSKSEALKQYSHVCL